MPTFGTLKLDATQQSESNGRPPRLREQWVKDVTALVEDTTQWARIAQAERRWSLESKSIEIAEEVVGGAYTVPALIIRAEAGELHLEPVARGVLGADGRVDLSAWPSLFRVMLLRKGTDWVVRTESGIDWPEPWGEQTFLGLAERLLNAE